MINVEDHLKLVRFVANNFWQHVERSGEQFDDLVGAGNLGLVRAAKAFDPGRGLAFSTFAVPHIRGAIQVYLRDCTRRVHVPRFARQLGSRIRKQGLEETTAAEVAAHFNLGIKMAQDGLLAAQVTISSLDVPTEDGALVYDLIPGHSDFTGVIVSDFISSLSHKHRSIITLRLKGLSQSEIGQAIGLSQVQVSRIIVQIGEKYRTYLGEGGERAEHRQKAFYPAAVAAGANLGTA